MAKLREDFYVYVWRGFPGTAREFVAYVGKGRRKRAFGHLRSSSKSLLTRAIKKHGAESFQVEFATSGQTETAAFRDERLLIYLLEPRYNLTDGGEGNSGYCPSPETREAMARAKRGRTLTDQHKKRIGDSSRGRSLAEEARKRLSLAHKGKRLSDEHCRKIGLSKRGLRRSAESVEKTRIGSARHYMPRIEKALEGFDGESVRELSKNTGVGRPALLRELRRRGWTVQGTGCSAKWVPPGTQAPQPPIQRAIETFPGTGAEKHAKRHHISCAAFCRELKAAGWSVSGTGTTARWIPPPSPLTRPPANTPGILPVTDHAGGP